MLRKKEILYCIWVGLFLFVAGCQSQNRFSVYGSEIVVYEGDWEVLSNCCHAAMSLMIDDIKQEKELDSNPPVNTVSRAWTENEQTIAHRTILSCLIDDQNYQIEISRIENKPARVTIDSPPDDSRLVNHLMELFSNFDVKPVDSN